MTDFQWARVKPILVGFRKEGIPAVLIRRLLRQFGLRMTTAQSTELRRHAAGATLAA